MEWGVSKGHTSQYVFSACTIVLESLKCEMKNILWYASVRGTHGNFIAQLHMKRGRIKQGRKPLLNMLSLKRLWAQGRM